MQNNEIPKPNFMVLRQKKNKGPIYKITICKCTLKVLEEEVISGIPEGWSIQDFYDLIDEGKRFFEPIDNLEVLKSFQPNNPITPFLKFH